MAGIRLVSVNYWEHKEKPNRWSVEGLQFGAVNLLVGKNATGKSRCINIIKHLSFMLLAEKAIYSEAGYEAKFDNDGVSIELSLFISEGRVVSESVKVDGDEKLSRENDKLKIFAESMNEFLNFEPSPKEIATAARRDKLQHHFLMPLKEWAESVRSYRFGKELGKEHFAVRVESKNNDEVDDRDENKVVAIFMHAKRRFGEEFVKSIKADMQILGYELDDIDSQTPDHIDFSLKAESGRELPLSSGQLQLIAVKEKDVTGLVFQDSISQGMFRALSILIQVNYTQMAERANCILIDDIGEGLDFGRAAALIELLREKAYKSEFQLIMSTNDQFVMNKVPLGEWSILVRNGNNVSVRNKHNSESEFEEFKFVGLSNFAFFEMDFLNSEFFEGESLKDE